MDHQSHHSGPTQYLQFDNNGNGANFIINPADANGSAPQLGSQYVTQYVKCIMPAYAAKDLHHQTIMIGPPPPSMLANSSTMVDNYSHGDRSFLDPQISSLSSDTSTTTSGSNQGRSSRSSRSNQDPEYRQRQAEAARQRRQDPEYRRREAEARRRRESDPEKLARKAEMMRIKRADPQYRARQAEARRRRESDPEKLARKAEMMRIKRADPQYRERQAQLRRLRRLNAEAMQRQPVYQPRARRNEPQPPPPPPPPPAPAPQRQTGRQATRQAARQATRQATRRAEEKKVHDSDTLRKRAEYMRRRRADPVYLENERRRRQELRLTKQIRILRGSYGQASASDNSGQHIDVNNFLSVMIHEGPGS